MKKEGIKIRIDSNLKCEFKKICDNESVTMSDKIHDFIFSEVKAMGNKDIKELLSQLGYKNIHIVDTTTFFWDGENIVLDNSSGRLLFIEEYRIGFSEFLNKGKDKVVFLFLNGCDFSKNIIRGTIVEK